MVLKAASLIPMCLVCMFLLRYPRLLDTLSLMRLICLDRSFGPGDVHNLTL